MRLNSRLRGGLIALLVLPVGCLKFCPSNPTGPCSITHDDCIANYYCSPAGVCTKECVVNSDCLVHCDESCGFSIGDDWAECIDGLCSSRSPASPRISKRYNGARRNSK